MNRWECQFANCSRTVVGVGGAVGLRAIGWWFKPGPEIFCPAHYPRTILCREVGVSERPCNFCAAEDQARILQNYLWAKEF